MGPTNVEDYYWIEYSKYSKKVIVKPSRRRKPNKIRSQKRSKWYELIITEHQLIGLHQQ